MPLNQDFKIPSALHVMILSLFLGVGIQHKRERYTILGRAQPTARKLETTSYAVSTTNWLWDLEAVTSPWMPNPALKQQLTKHFCHQVVIL